MASQRYYNNTVCNGHFLTGVERFTHIIIMKLLAVWIKDKLKALKQILKNKK